MSLPYLHLLLNHFPIATLLFGFAILLAGRIQRDESVMRVALSLLVLGGFIAGASFLTGDPAAEALKANPSFAEKLVHEHELAANFGLWSMVITAGAAAVGMYLSRKKGALPKPYLIFLFVVTFWAVSVIARTNYLGGQISHPETRSASK